MKAVRVGGSVSGLIEAVCKSSGHKSLAGVSVFMAVMLTLELKPLIPTGSHLDGTVLEAGLALISSTVLFNSDCVSLGCVAAESLYDSPFLLVSVVACLTVALMQMGLIMSNPQFSKWS